MEYPVEQWMVDFEQARVVGRVGVWNLEGFVVRLDVGFPADTFQNGARPEPASITGHHAGKLHEQLIYLWVVAVECQKIQR